MLRWRFFLGTVLVAALLGLFWLDHAASLPGLALMPVLVASVVLGTQELLGLLRAGGLGPGAVTVYGANLLVVLAPWLGPLAVQLADEAGPGGIPSGAGAGGLWIALAMGIGLVALFAAQIRRFRAPDTAAANVAGAALAMVYLGLLPGLLVQLRMDWGIAALASLLIIVKLGDTGAYAAGKLLGRHKLAPVLSPGKTVEGAFGALVACCIGAWATFQWLVPAITGSPPCSGIGWRAVLFGAALCVAGMLGDLSESLLKRGAGRKESSTWMPGFGGVLDMLDSVLLAGPVAYLLWLAGLVP
ncbi:MAG TPA: hypothetical protein EYH34_16345 [Planctomycetes bacterium]|nr:hypothetical protein [Planctomycetota bacterium]